MPSGSNLDQAMAAQVDPERGFVDELGAGTGAIVRALIARGVTLEQLVQMFSSLGVGGVLVQFTNSPLPPIPEVPKQLRKPL